MQKILSLIIPTYNMSLYIERCLQSLLSDGTNHDLEILVINDGSIDDSPERRNEWPGLRHRPYV